MFEHIEPRHVESASKRIQIVSRGLRTEAKEKIKSLTSNFHDNAKWETVCQRWEQMLLDAAIKEDEGETFHTCVMSILSTMFSVGFDEGLQFKADEVVQKLLKESNG